MNISTDESQVLFEYLDRLIALQAGGHNVRREIDEAIKEIRTRVFNFGELPPIKYETTVKFDSQKIVDEVARRIREQMRAGGDDLQRLRGIRGDAL